MNTCFLKRFAIEPTVSQKFHTLRWEILPKRWAIDSATSELDDRNKEAAGACVPAFTAHASQYSRPFIKMEPTVLGGMAHAQSLHKLPCEQAFSTLAGEHSVVPIHIIRESTSRVTCKASAGREGSDDARYRTSTDIMAVVGRWKVVTWPDILTWMAWLRWLGQWPWYVGHSIAACCVDIQFTTFMLSI